MRRFLFLIAIALGLAQGALAEALVLPAQLTEIGDEAFLGDSSVAEVVVPQGVLSIGENAFCDCTGLCRITIPASVEHLAETFVSGCAPDLLIRTEPGSAACAFAQTHQMDYQADTVYRALLVGQVYEAHPALTLDGPENDVRAMQACLEMYENTPYQVRVSMDLTGGEILDAIRECFADAQSQDVSLFYYSGHGVSSSDSALQGAFLGADGQSAVTAAQLRAALDNIPGRKIVIIDACYSGNMLNGGSDADSGADSDPGTDTNTDSGADSDAGTNTDSGAGSDAGTDTNTDSGADSDAGSDADSDADSGAGSGAGSNAGTDTNTDSGADSDAGSDADSDADSGADSDAGTDTNTDSGADLNAGSGADLNAGSGADSNADSVVAKSASLTSDADSAAEAMSAQEFVDSFIVAFSRSTRAGLAGSGYFVLTAAAADEMSYEGFVGDRVMGLFTSRLLRGCGYDFVADSPGAIAADSNSNGVLTLSELYNYTGEQLAAWGQHIQVYPTGCAWFGMLRR